MNKLKPASPSSSLANVRSKRTRPERLVAAVLLKMGASFKQNVASLPGSPDFVIEGMKKVIFVHGCYWHRHGCSKSSTPKTNRDYWIPKFARNVKRDRKVVAQLKRRGWLVLILWECKLSDGRSLFQVLRRFLNKSAPLPRPRKSNAPARTPFQRKRHNVGEASGVG
ncbi:MAG: DNA mismatch endonuclease Vsr [Planctomycetia bacterium]|nr:DNA mismatch endonuclease Vsr [Planctomycetia bacterium]